MAYGMAFFLAWPVAYCMAHGLLHAERSECDGDGQSNGLELGDPCCQWQQGMPFPRDHDISDPSSQLSRTNARVTLSIGCQLHFIGRISPHATALKHATCWINVVQCVAMFHNVDGHSSPAGCFTPSPSEARSPPPTHMSRSS